jgi:hypothetical protein
MRLALIERLLGNKPDDGKATVRVLIKFLRKHGIRRQFIRAFNNHKLNLRYENLNDICIDVAPVDWITLAFQWNMTKEGRDFWEHKNLEWIDYLISNDKKYQNLV